MMNKYFKIFLISILSLLGILGIAFVLIYQNVETLKKYALEELNKHLKSPLTTSEISVSVLSTFPLVSLELKEVSMADPLFKNKKLIEAQRLFLGFNLFDVINKNYKVQLIQLDSGSLNLRLDAKGNQNFNILKSESTQAKSVATPFSFQLNRVGLNRMNLSYDDLSTQTYINVFAQSAEIGGQFTDKEFEMSLKLSGLSNEMRFGSVNMFKDKNLNLNLAFQVNNQTNSYVIKKGEFSVNTLFLHLIGDMKFNKKSSDYNLSFSADKITIQDLISIMPIEVPEKIKAAASQGKVFFKGKYLGKQSQQLSPELLIDFGIEEGKLIDPDSGLEIDKINLTGKYSGNSDIRKAKLYLSSLTAQLPGSTLTGSLSLENLENPQLFAELTGIADLATLHEFFKFEDVNLLSGNLDFTLTIKGNKVDSTWKWDPNFSKGIFKLYIPALGISYLSKPFKDIELTAALNGNNLTIDNLKFLIGESDFRLQGDFPNILDNANHVLNGNVNLVCEFLSSDDLLLYNSKDPKEAGDETFEYKIALNLLAKKFKSGNFSANNLACKTRLTPSKTEIPYFSLQTCEGSFSGEASWQMTPDGYLLKANHQATHINLSQLLTSFDNFGQTEITATHLKGFLSAQTDMIIYVDPKLKVDLNKLLLVTAMNIKQGELIDYKPLLGLSKFADVEELKHLKFSELQNTLTIKNNVITIPEMDIRSNAFNLGFSGKHTFENKVNYRIKLALSQLIKKKRKIQPNEFGEEDPVSKNWIIYVNIEGPLSNLKYTFDRKGASQNLKEEVKKEKDNIKEILKQEFQVKKDTSLKNVETNNDNPDELEFETE